MHQPEKDRFCLKCGNFGHNMLSCTDEYCSEDLKVCGLFENCYLVGPYVINLSRIQFTVN